MRQAKAWRSRHTSKEFSWVTAVVPWFDQFVSVGVSARSQHRVVRMNAEVLVFKACCLTCVEEHAANACNGKFTCLILGPVAMVVAVKLCQSSGFGGPGTFVVVFLHMFIKLIQLFGDDDFTNPEKVRHFSENIRQRGRKKVQVCGLVLR